MRHLRALCAIADTGSLHQAARRLGVSQPSLTTQLQRIERTLGAELFRRERTGCRPTLLGRSVLSRARPLVDGMSALIGAATAEAAAARAAWVPACGSDPPRAASSAAGCADCG